ILAYYRYAGMIASMALLINGLLIFSIMIFIQQPLTLPGLAGLVLTVGMSVDANVLIFERIREEKQKGSAPRMAIRNGFDRAFTTIMDSNLTTLIAAIVLYWIGTDQVRGFAVALIIGIATSMFTATFCSRIVFEIFEKLKRINLSMSDGVGFMKRTFLGAADINFMGMRTACTVLSGLLIVGGIAAVSLRGKELLNIDFTGGTGVIFQLQQPVAVDTLRDITKEILAVDQDGQPVQSTLVRIEKEPKDTVYSLITSISDVDYLSQMLVDGFAKKNSANLVTYRVRVLKDKSTASSSYHQHSATRKVRFVAFQDESAAAPESPATSATQAPNTNNQAPPPPQEAVGAPTDEMTEMVLEFSGSNDDSPGIAAADKGAKIDGPTLLQQLIDAAKAAGVELNQTLIEVTPEPLPTGWRSDDVAGFSTWLVKLPVSQDAADAVIAKLTSQIQKQPMWLSLSQIGTRVAGEMQQRAIGAILLSLVFIVGYIWFRFQKVAYGLAAVIALVHDVIITLGILAVCHWLAPYLGFLLVKIL
ncbi:MAG: MMPL family transporter, partial [Planctomycetales bacterium]|nr:MMPL family transporter [Planctomycetales bacterium]